jgi:hypothetical protein
MSSPVLVFVFDVMSSFNQNGFMFIFFTLAESQNSALKKQNFLEKKAFLLLKQSEKIDERYSINYNAIANPRRSLGPTKGPLGARTQPHPDPPSAHLLDVGIKLNFSILFAPTKGNP